MVIKNVLGYANSYFSVWGYVSTKKVGNHWNYATNGIVSIYRVSGFHCPSLYSSLPDNFNLWMPMRKKTADSLIENIKSILDWL